MRKAWYTAKLIVSLIWISVRPNATNAAFAIADCLLKLGLIQKEVEHLRQSSDARAAIDGRHLISELRLEELRTFPEGSLAREFAERMIRENLQPDFYDKLEIKNDETFVMMRLRQTHDLWHTLTGFGSSVADELGLQAFVMAQCQSPLSPLLIGGRLAVTALSNPTMAGEIVSKVSRGWTMGENAKPIFALDWEKYWDRPLTEVRAEYGIA
ncbi:MAG: Coq4 family protein [Bdellovibrionia bacterium]